jgi:hypothetical protein
MGRVTSLTPLLLYPQGKGHWYPLDRRLGGPQNRSGGGGEEKICSPCRDSNPRSSSQWPSAIPLSYHSGEHYTPYDSWTRSSQPAALMRRLQSQSERNIYFTLQPVPCAWIHPIYEMLMKQFVCFTSRNIVRVIKSRRMR